jgi:hypothetical protein
MLRCPISASIALLIPLVAPANAQPASFRGPVAGLVYARDSRSIRPLQGVPGAAFVGQPVLSEVDWASVAPDGGWALVTREGSTKFIRGLAGSAPLEPPADGLIDAVDRVVWSRAGNFALLFSSSGNQLQRVRLAGNAVFADSPVVLPVTGPVTALAIDPAGLQIAVGIAGSEAPGLYLLRPGQPIVQVSSMVRPAVAAFDDTGGRLYAVDLNTRQILEFDSGAGGFEFARLSAPDEPALNPVGLAVSGNGRYLMLADSATRVVRLYETDSRSLIDTIPLDFAPLCLEALSSDPSYLLNGDSGKEWLLVLDARQFPKVHFVPTNREEPL